MALAYHEYYTVKDYQSWQGEWELIEGIPYAIAPSPSVTHQTVAANVIFQFKLQFNKHKGSCGEYYSLMETDWYISNDTVVRSDIMVVCQTIDEKVEVTPNLIVEIISLSSTKRDKSIKFELYQREGVKYYILVYPEKLIANIYQNKNNSFQKINDSTPIEFHIGKCYFSFDSTHI